MKIAVASVVVTAGLIAAFYGYATSEFTECFAQFDSTEAAKRAASYARAAGHAPDVEDDDADARLPSSRGGRQISVVFSDGETGEDAREFRRLFHAVVAEEDGGFGHPNRGCLERPPFD